MDNTWNDNGFEQEPVEHSENPVEQTPAEEPVAEAQPENQTEQIPEEAQAPQPEANPTSGGKTSPFADSPYTSYYTPQPQPPKAKKKMSKAGRNVLAAGLALVLVAGSCGITAMAVNSRWQKETAALDSKIASLQSQIQENSKKNPTGQSISGSPLASTGEGLTPGEVYARNVNSVVAISNKTLSTNIYGQTSETASSGSGFIISEDGYVVTNYHVIEKANTLSVITYDTTEYDATVVGYDQGNDVALLKIEATGLQPVTIGSSTNLIVGDQVVAIGNPLGELTSTLTVGYVSATNRTINTDGTNINMMQTDAAINPGNSGGPLFNMKGEVIGITTAKYSGETSSGATIEGIGFAIPIDDVLDMLDDLRQYGYVTGGYLGVTVREMDKATADAYSLPLGSYVTGVTDGSCAEKAGIQQKDIITGLGDRTISGNSDLTRALREFDGGDETTVTVYRAGQTLTLPITLDEKPQPTEPEETTPYSGELPYGGEMPSSGDYEEWFDFFSPFFGWRG